MLLFRSEEDVKAWVSERNIKHGATVPLQTLWKLAEAWYHDRLQRDWRRKTPEEIKTLFDSLGLSGEFWSLA